MRDWRVTAMYGRAVEELKNAVLPDCFEVDYVRVFDEIK